MKRISYNEYKLCLLTIKYVPIIMFLIMWIHTGFLLMGINGVIADRVAGCAIIPSILIFSMSHVFKFCYIHRALTIYSLITDLCINFERYFGFGCMRDSIRIIMFSIGLILFLLLLFKFKQYQSKCCTQKNINYGD